MDFEVREIDGRRDARSWRASGLSTFGLWILE